MSVREEVCHIVQGLSDEELRVVARMLRGLQAPSAVAKLDAETQAWMDADLVEELPPYDWGDVDPMTVGEAIRYEPGIGWVVGGSDEE